MKYKQLLPVFLVLSMTGCGSESSDSTDSTGGDESAPPPGFEFPGAGAEAVVISTRTYTHGSVTVKVTGFFEASGSQTLNIPASITDESHTWIQYGVSGAPELNVMFTNNQDMAEHGLTIGVGPYTVTAGSSSGECQSEFDVTPVLVAGRYSCTGSAGYNKETGEMGNVDIEVEFSAGS